MDTSVFRLSTPVVLLVFSRPDTTARVLEAVRQAEPPRLLVVADGPRADHPADAEKCAAARAVVEQVDWDCEVLTNYAEVNMGLADRVSSGLGWVFSLSDRAIVLEDDCVPHPTFFRFCEELLRRYEEDERVMAVSGSNFQFGRRRTGDSYYFSHYPHCWGWATWQRAWRHYDQSMSLWPVMRAGGWLEDVLGDRRAVVYWEKVFDAVRAGLVNTWAYQWVFACWAQSGLSILPSANLVSNIGFGSAATHTRSQRSRYAHMETTAMPFPLTHPRLVVRDARADAYTQRTHYQGTSLLARARGWVSGALRR